MRFKQKQVLLLISIALVAVTLAAYEPIRHNDFVEYDDSIYLTENPNVRGGITRDSVIWAFTTLHAANWHPLAWLSHMLDCEIYGLNPLGHHITSLLIHIANSLLLFLLLSKMTGTLWRSAFVAAAFALHPLHVESVAWVAERKDVLSGLFWMLTILAYLRYAEHPNIKRYMLVLLAFIMGLMSKPMVVTLPFVLLLLDYWPLERVIMGRQTKTLTSKATDRQKVSVRRLVVEKIPLLVLSGVLSMTTFITQQRGGAVATLEEVPINYRIANMFISYIRYIGKVIWPSRLAVIYPHPHANLQMDEAVVCALLFVLITVLSIYIGRRRKYVVVGWLWYVGTLVPVIGLVQAGMQSMADRYMYIPILGLLFIIVWTIKDVVGNRPRRKVVTAVLSIVALSTSLILTRMQIKYWQNSMILFEHAVKVTKDNTIAENSYGWALFEVGRINEAVAHLSDAVRINPVFFGARNNLGKALLKQGKFNEAIACFNAVLGHQEVNAVDVYTNLGAAYTQLGKYEPAIQNLTKAMELKPDSADALNNMAWLLATVGDVSIQDANKAIGFAQHACELTGYNNPSYLDTLAAAYAAAGRFDEAVNTANKAIDAAKATGQEDLAGRIQGRIKLYQSGQRYHQK